MKENRRIQMTKRLLKDSVFELLEEKPLNKITIKEICENADINRTTFYKYYGDQYALVKDAEDELLDKTSEFIRNLNSKNEDGIALLEEFLSYVKNNKDTFRILLDKNSNTEFRYRMMIAAMELVMTEKYELNIKEEDKKYVYCMIIMGAVSTIGLWVNSDCEQTVEYMAELMFNLVLTGLRGIEI